MKRTLVKPEYFMPAEWERHDATWLAWPKDPLTFPPGIIEPVEELYVKMIRSLSHGERVNLLVDDAETRRRVSSLVGDSAKVAYHLIKTADVWMRDYGPIFARDKRGGLVATKWRFNAWGNKYDELKADDKAGLEVAKATGLKIIEPGFVLEGGSIDTNGRGTCITTEQCLLNRNRNPGYGREEIEEVLERYLGFTDVVWLGTGIAGDDTDGHIDDLARFVDEGTILCMVEEDRRDENYAPLSENLELLRSAKDQSGRKLKVIPVSMPRKKVGGDERLPASYANFYVGNSVVLVPTFDDVNDRAALATIAEAFLKKEIVGINCEALVYGFGGIHCVTQQQPTS
jgi:agmatine deiminase